MPLRSEAAYGGVGMYEQVRALRRGIDILIAAPGRLLDHVERRTVRLSGVKVLILDEADRMLDMGFLPAIRRIGRAHHGPDTVQATQSACAGGDRMSPPAGSTSRAYRTSSISI